MSDSTTGTSQLLVNPDNIHKEQCRAFHIVDGKLPHCQGIEGHDDAHVDGDGAVWSEPSKRLTEDGRLPFKNQG